MRLRVALVSLLAGTLLAAGLAAQTEGRPEIRLFDLTTAHGVVDNKPFRPTRLFAPDDNRIYVWFRGEGCTTGTTIMSNWFYLETDPPLQFTEGAVTVERPDNWGQFNFELAPGKHWSVGEYRIELRVGDVLMAETYFRVSAPETPRDEGRRRLHDIRQPALFLAAEHDHLVPAVAQSRDMANRAPSSVMRILKGHSHICLIAPDVDLAQILHEWQEASDPM